MKIYENIVQGTRHLQDPINKIQIAVKAPNMSTNRVSFRHEMF